VPHNARQSRSGRRQWSFTGFDFHHKPVKNIHVKILRHTDPDFGAQIESMSRQTSLFDPAIEQRTRDIINAVRDGGDAALLELTARFDGAKLTADQLAVTAAEFFNASVKVGKELREAMRLACKNIARFSKRSLRRSWVVRNAQGALVGERYDPFERVGVYVPGGTAPLVSTVLMTVVLARVAGCRQIVMCTPCGPDGSIEPALLVAAKIAGATEIYRVGGAQAIAAMAMGTETIKPVQKIFGPGNAYVVMAKRLLFGRVSIDLLPGPSELLVLADDSAKPAHVAADMLAQGEHGSGHERVWLVTPSSRLITAVQREIEQRLPSLSRREYIKEALGRGGWLVQVRDMEGGVEVANTLAPEHCEIIAKNGRRLAARILTAGAIFLGQWSPTAVGDYLAGPSHTLPTGGAGRSFGGLAADQFQRRTSIVEYNRSALAKSLHPLDVLAGLEGLEAHAESAKVRFIRTGSRAKGM